MSLAWTSPCWSCAVPVAPPAALALLAPHVDELVCLSAQPRLRPVGQWYERFDQTDDKEVQALLAAAWQARVPAALR